MRNYGNNSKLTLTKKVAEFFMKVGDIHANELSFGCGMYEPKISINILKKSNKINK